MAQSPAGTRDKSTKAESDSATASANWAAYVRGRDAGHFEWAQSARRFDNYYFGDQWDEADLKRLEAEGRPALTINQVLPTINTVLGEQAAYRAMIRFKPRHNASNDTAMMLQKVVMATLDNLDFDWKESEVFADGLINDRGYFDIRMNFDGNVFGEIDITDEDPTDIVLDPDAKEYDPATWSEVSKSRWLSIDAVEHDYGEDAAKKVKNQVYSRNDFDKDAYHFESTFGESTHVDVTNVGDRERALKSVRVIERQHKQFTDVKMFVGPQGDLTPVPPFWSELQVGVFAANNGYQVIEQRAFRVRWTVTAGEDVLLHDDWSPYPWFTIVPYFPYFRRGKPFGMVRNLISPQEQLNKLSSQELHIINTTANSGWVIEENSLGDGLTLADIEQKGSKTGFVLSYKQGRQAPEKIQPNQVPSGVDRMSLKAQTFIRDISGIHAPMQGNASPELSGKALQSQIARGQVQIQKPLDNLARTRRMVAERMLYLIQTYYTEERIFYIGNDLDPEAPEQEIVINQQTAEGIANDVTVGKYQVTVSQQPSRDTYQSTQFSQLLEMRQLGIPIPDHMLVQYTNIAKRDELVEVLKAQAGLNEPTPEQQELAAFQRDAQIQSIQLDLQTKQAKIAELMAKVENTNAKTASELDPNAFQNVMQIMELQADVQKNIDNLSARMELARMSYSQDAQKAGGNLMVQMRGQDMQQETQITTAALNAIPGNGEDSPQTQQRRQQTDKRES